MGEAWRLLLDPPATAAWNMSVDEALLAQVAAGGPALRLYRFARPAASLGYRQGVPPWSARAAARGMEIARRPSGGGTVLHVGDLTYAVVAPRGWPGLPRSARESYAWVRDALAGALAALGLAVQPARPDPGAERSELCFAARTGAELELGGCKLVGSAQRRSRAGWLQHGSIRLRDDSPWYRDVLGVPAPRFAPLPPDLDAGQLLRAIVGAFALRSGCALEPVALRADELREARIRHARRLATPLLPSCLAETPAALR